MLKLLSQPALANPDLSFLSIAFLTFEAVLEVVLICFAGFIAARAGLLNVAAQKVISSLNVDLFTPCLVFSKLAPSLSLKRMADIVIIPIFYAVSTAISFVCSRVVGRSLGLNDPERDFVTAMAVFGNSNSLPVSLTLSLAYTLPDLLWEDIDNDTPDQVASRGILYLLIFQQLGQILRWSWGYNKLLRLRSQVELNSMPGVYDEEAEPRSPDEREIAANSDSDFDLDLASAPVTMDATASLLAHSRGATYSSVGESGLDASLQTESKFSAFLLGPLGFCRHYLRWFAARPGVRLFLAFMNPPLYAMFISIIVATVPALQLAFFGDNFLRNTVTEAITQLGSVSIPLILIVLGLNLCPTNDLPPPAKHHTKIVFGSLVSRMIIPPIVLLPTIALCVKYINVSILDDPIFLIVAFILSISPPAIQLSQIVQLNNIYQQEMGSVLFWGYVVLTLPTTIFIVVTSLEVIKWTA